MDMGDDTKYKIGPKAFRGSGIDGVDEGSRGHGMQLQPQKSPPGGGFTYEMGDRDPSELQ